MNIHILACGGAVMHNIALALHQLGHTITGSDDEIFEPALSRLQQAGICPPAFGWYPEKIDQHLDFIIIGMHARADNPELLKAQSLGLKIYSFPDYVYEHAKNKTRVVIGGSHGKRNFSIRHHSHIHHGHVSKSHKEECGFTSSGNRWARRNSDCHRRRMDLGANV